MNTLGLWQQCVLCGSLCCWALCCCECDFVNALASEAPNEECQQLTEKEGWKGKFRSGQRVGVGVSGMDRIEGVELKEGGSRIRVYT